VETKKRTKLEADYAEAAGKVTLLESAVKNLTFQKESLAVSHRPPPPSPRNKKPPPHISTSNAPLDLYTRAVNGGFRALQQAMEQGGELQEAKELVEKLKELLKEETEARQRDQQEHEVALSKAKEEAEEGRAALERQLKGAEAEVASLTDRCDLGSGV
jgi:hypothetical protein